MSIFLNKKTTVLVQGATGKEGLRAIASMRAYHTRVACGVTPGKAGQTAENVPVFDTVRQAIGAFPEISATALYIPPSAAKAAMLEAIEAGIPLIAVMTEKIPLRDTAYCLAAAVERGVRILGPGSLGCLVPGIGRLGVIGGPLVEDIYVPGSIGVISRSGGMTNELSWLVRRAGLGQSAAVHVGGDLLIGTAYAELLRLFEEDDATKAVVLYAEQGANYEREVAEILARREFTKPLAIHVGGAFAASMPEGSVVGHAGAIVAAGQSAADKSTALREAGALIAERFDDLVELVQDSARL